jgi:hypothetical protein
MIEEDDPLPKPSDQQLNPIRLIGFVAAVMLVPVTAFAQAKPAAPAAAPAEPAVTWDKLPRMQLERQFAGPLQDTLIQRWRDPVDGMVCYIYLPISAQHTAPTTGGFVQYGPNVVGSISCAPGPAVVAAAPAAAARPTAAEPKGRSAKPSAAEPKPQ